MSSHCAVCLCELQFVDFAKHAPAILSTGRIVDMPTIVKICRNCGHGQSNALPNIFEFYDSEYRISLDSHDHDQLYEIGPQGNVYRTDKQAQIAVDRLSFTTGARVLDFGSGKATTLRKIMDSRPDLDGHVFDVSSEYYSTWTSWLAVSRVATYEIPDDWYASFDYVLSHFVLEHVSDPIASLTKLAKLCRPGGTVFFSVPNPNQNSGDLLVADHAQHFTEHSIRLALSTTGFEKVEVLDQVFRGAFVVIAKFSQEVKFGFSETKSDMASANTKSLVDLCSYWTQCFAELDLNIANSQNRKIAIYGAGFYGALLFSRKINWGNLVCFVDRNEHLHGTKLFDVPIVFPHELPEAVSVVFVALNPLSVSADFEIAEWKGRNVELVLFALQ